MERKKELQKKFVHLVRDILYRHIKLTIIIYFLWGIRVIREIDFGGGTFVVLHFSHLKDGQEEGGQSRPHTDRVMRC